MLSWAYVNLKPGVGKTTCAVFTCAALADRGFRPLLADCDPAASALRWSDLAGGFRWPVVGLAVTDVYRRIGDVLPAGVDAVVYDVPQIEDHARIARGVLRAAGCWVAPVAPSGIEVDRMSRVADEWEDVQSLRVTRADAVVLLNRTNRPEATRTGPDSEVRQALTSRGYHVLATQVQHSDTLYRQAFGCPPVAAGTAYESLVSELLARQDARALA
ncbi:MAG: ParA family protein [Pseudonocardiaceae bacterium]